MSTWLEPICPLRQDSCAPAGTKLELFHGVTLLRLGGHFPGSSVLHWAGHAEHGAGGVLFTGCPGLVLGTVGSLGILLRQQH